MFNCHSNTAADHLSVEVNGEDFFSDSCFSNPVVEPDLCSLFECNLFEHQLYSAGHCQSSNSFESIASGDESHEFDEYLGPSLAEESNLTLTVDPDPFYNHILPISVDDQKKDKKSFKKQILLSPSVGVGAPQRFTTSSGKIEIVHELEETFRPRYKTDYFGQNGVNRKPRYVADRLGNHFVTLKVPLGVTGKIRVDWLTVPMEDGTRYVMPYQFQESNDSMDVPDRNPLFVDIQTDALGTMKVYLVLIKAKQDALKLSQPLQPYHPMKNIFGVVDKPTSGKTPRLTAKQLIKNFQLCKSQLAFTLCKTNDNGQSYTTEWTSSVLSTVLEENAKEVLPTKAVPCPNCAFSVDITDEEVKPVNKRKSMQPKTEKPGWLKRQRNSSVLTYCFK